MFRDRGVVQVPVVGENPRFVARTSDGLVAFDITLNAGLYAPERQERILAFLDDSILVTRNRFWQVEALDKWLDLIRSRGILKKGAKDKIVGIPNVQRVEVDILIERIPINEDAMFDLALPMTDAHESKERG